MAKDQLSSKSPQFGVIRSVSELGQIMKSYRKKRGLSLEKVSGLINLGTRFLSELERGKETAEIGKVLLALNSLGLEISIQPRGYNLAKENNNKTSRDLADDE